MSRVTSLAIGLTLAATVLAPPADAQRRGGNRPGGGGISRAPAHPPPPRVAADSGLQVRSAANTSINHGSRQGGYARGYWDDDYHPAAATRALIGAIVRSVPPGCATVILDDISYVQCGSTWYQPQYIGLTVQYLVVAPPR